MVDKRVGKIFTLGIIWIFLLMFMSGFVLAVNHEPGGAQDPITETGKQTGERLGEDVKGFADGVKAFFGTALEDVAFGDDEWLSKIFFAVLLGMIIYTVIGSFFSGSSSTVKFIITGAVVAISFVGMPPGYLESLRLSYGALGLSILAVIPFIIMLAFTLKVNSLAIARGTWAFFIIYYLFLFGNEIWNAKSGATTMPYWIALIGGLLMFFSIAYWRNWILVSKVDTQEERAGHAVSRMGAGVGVAGDILDKTAGAAPSS